MKLEAEDCPFVFAFYEACECLREAMRSERDWLVVANEYTYFLDSEAKDLSNRKSHLHNKVNLENFFYMRQVFHVLFFTPGMIFF
mgnify:CR=1 FL=1